MDTFFNKYFGDNNDEELQQALEAYNKAYKDLILLVEKKEEDKKSKYRNPYGQYNMGMFDKLFASSWSNSFEDILKDLDNMSDFNSQSWSSADGTARYSSYTRTSGMDDLDDEAKSEKHLTMLKNEMGLAVSEQDYEKAAELRNEIREIESEKDK